MRAVVAEKASSSQSEEWLKKHGVKADEDGTFTEIPYDKDGAAATPTQILENVKVNALRYDVPNLHQREFTKKTMVYVGGGPSLKHHLEEVKKKCLDENYDVYASNKTVSYLVSQGVIPNFHIIIDPQESKCKDLDYNADIELYLGLQCHPKLFEKAISKGKKISKFLASSVTDHDGTSDQELARAACHAGDSDILGIGGGSTTGVRAIYFAFALGYRRLEYYGFDGNVEMDEKGVVQCYSYFKPRGENILETQASNGRVFYTTAVMLGQADELVTFMEILPGLDIEIYGDSLLSNHLKIYKETKKNLDIRITPEYLELQKSFHDDEHYGKGGHANAPRVYMAASQIHRKLGSCSVLDYGCGKGNLVRSIEATFAPIPNMTFREYDPSIPEKSAEPEPCDLVYCGDVMEHVEEGCTDAVIRHIASLTKQLLIVLIATAPAKKNLPDGRNAHITLKDEQWWLSKFRKHFIAVETGKNEDYVMLVMMPIPK